MSDMTDDIIDGIISGTPHRSSRKPLIIDEETLFLKAYEDRKLIWTNRKGKDILIHTMSNRYLNNCKKFLANMEDKNVFEKAYLKIFKMELKRRKQLKKSK